MVDVAKFDTSEKVILSFAEGESLEIKINGVSKFYESVPAGKVALVKMEVISKLAE